MMSLWIFLLTIVTVAALEQIQCGSSISAQITSTTTHDYLVNLSSPEYSNLSSLDVEFTTSPSLPIEIYFINTTIYNSCNKQCYVRQMQTSRNYVVRLNKYLRDSQVINYTFSVICNKPKYITTSTYTTNINTYMSLSTSPPFDYSVSFNQQLTFRNRGNILSFGVSILIVLFFITIGLFHHYDSERPELLFLARKSNAPYYLCSLATLLFCIIMVSTRYTDKHLLGILVVLTMTSINFVAVIGMKYYGSYISNIKIKNTNLTLARLCRWSVLLLLIFYLTFYYICLYRGISLKLTVLIIIYIELALLSVASFASKTAQIQWCILFILIWWLHDSTVEEIFFDFYWYSMFCIGCALGTIFLFSNKQHSVHLKTMFINVFGAFISIFDIATDVTVMVQWVRQELYFWTIMQLVFIFTGTIYAAFYIDDYYFIDDGSSQKNAELESNEKTKRLFWGRIFTLFGLGRVYHGVLGWDEDRNKDMEISNRILKVWELIFESFPTICLQTWISLYTDLDVNIVLSLFVGFASISFTFFRVLYGDHSSDEREAEFIIAQRLREKLRISGSMRNVNYNKSAPSLQSKEQSARTKIISLNQEDGTKSAQKHTRKRSSLSTAAAAVRESQTCRNLWRHFVCCYPVKMCVDYSTKDDNKEKEQHALTWKDKCFYLGLYLWVITDFGVRIFPILACARLRQQYLEFLAVMFGLTLFEFFSYYYMLSGEFKTPRSATHFFWTLYFTIAYCLLSTMHLVYLPNNVIFDRLIVEHCLRMCIQSVFMVIAMVIQYYEYGAVLGFLDYSIMLFWVVWVFNWMLTFVIKRGFKQIEDKIQIVYFPTRNSNMDDVEDQTAIQLTAVKSDMTM